MAFNLQIADYVIYKYHLANHFLELYWWITAPYLEIIISLPPHQWRTFELKHVSIAFDFALPFLFVLSSRYKRCLFVMGPQRGSEES